MSIATLKRKTQAQYNNMSVNAVGGFSLNGTRRSQGFVGQTTLSRTLVRTLAKGPTLKGHGGCCGQYPITNIRTSPDMAIMNDPAVIKPSVINTNGLILTKYRWIRRPQPFTTVKPDATHNINDQTSYIDSVERKAMACDNEKKTTIAQTCKKCVLPGAPGTKDYQNSSNQATVITKPDSYTGALTASDQIAKLKNTCVKWDKMKFSNNTQNIPFGCGNP
jgi:hypothetical protein